MQELYFGTKELYHVVLKANTNMSFGARRVEEGEPVLYFDHIAMSTLTEMSTPIIARGGWGNMPRVIWEDRSEITFSMTEGVMNSTGLGILLSAKMLERGKRDVLCIPRKEGPFLLNEDNGHYCDYFPSKEKKMFCYRFMDGVIQERVPITTYGKKIIVDNGEQDSEYLLDYYFEYGDESILYLIEKERFMGTFTLEGKFYTKDEVYGKNITNVLTMPKVRIVSGINLRLGERAEPTTSVFNVIAAPVKTEESNDELMRIVRLSEDIDADI